MADDPNRELTVEELEEAAGGAEANVVCPTTNEKSCNDQCKPSVATDAA